MTEFSWCSANKHLKPPNLPKSGFRVLQSASGKAAAARRVDQLKDGVIVITVKSKTSSVGSNSNSRRNVKHVKETDTAVLRYDRVAMLEAVLSIRDRQQQFIRWAIVALLFLAGVVVIAAGILGWLS